MRLSQLIDDAVAADKKPRAGDRDASTPERRSARRIAPARRRRAAARQARRAVVERGAAAREAPVRRREGRAHRHARSARHRACCRCASARRPSSRSSCSTPTSATRRPCASASTTTTGDAEGEVAAIAAGRVDARRRSKRCCARFRRAQRAGAADVLGAQARGRAATTTTRARASRSRAPPREVEIHALDAARLERAGRRSRRRVQQGHLHPRARRGHRRGAGLRRAPRGAAADGDRRLRHRRRGHARALGGDGATPSARRAAAAGRTRCCATCRALRPRRAPTPRASGRAARCRRPERSPARCAVYAPDGDFLGRGRRRRRAWRSRARVVGRTTPD